MNNDIETLYIILGVWAFSMSIYLSWFTFHDDLESRIESRLDEYKKRLEHLEEYHEKN